MKDSLSFLKKHMLTMAFVCSAFQLMAEQVTVTVSTRDENLTGTENFSNLEQALAKAGYDSSEALAGITDLKITTEGKYSSGTREFNIALDANDFSFLNTKLPALSNLDISEAIVTNSYDGSRESNNNIPNNAFLNNQNIKTISLPTTLEIINSGAFFNCALEGIINLPDNVNENRVGYDQFGNSQGITGFQASDEATKITTVDGVIFTKDMSYIILYPAGKTDKDYTIPEGVISIRNSAFENNHHLKNLTFPTTLVTTQAGDTRFDVIANFSEIENIYVAEGNERFGSANGMLYQRYYMENETKVEDEKIVWSPRGKTVLRIPDPMHKIAGGGSQNNVFGGNGTNSYLKESNNYTKVITLIDFPATFEEIENGAFVGAENLEKIICRAATAPKTGSSSFREVGKNCGYQTAIYVPANALDAYKNSNWVDKAQIDEVTYSGFNANNFFAFYQLSVTNGIAESPLANDIAAEGNVVTITATEAPTGQKFDKWVCTSGNVTFEDATAETTTFTMPANDVEINATYIYTQPTEINYNHQETGLTIYTEKSNIYIKTNMPQTISIYAIDGRIIKSVSLKNGTTIVNGLSQGVYIINNQKIIIR